jgi:mannose-1-phosphate guanylyltransferase
MWNAFILAASATALISTFERRCPEIVIAMRAAVQRDLHTPRDGLAAADLYAGLPDLDFSRHVLEGSEALLRVVPAPACGWSDLGTPKRVGEALRRLAAHDDAGHAPLGSTACLNLAAQHARLQLAV